MDKKLKRVLVWSSVISVSCIIFLYSISYVFPIPVQKVESLEDIQNTDNNVINVNFEENLRNNHIKFNKLSFNIHSESEFYMYELNGQMHLKPFIWRNINVGSKSVDRYDFAPIKVDGTELIAYMQLEALEAVSFFVYNNVTETLTEYFISGKVGRIFTDLKNPYFFFDNRAGPEMYKKLYILEDHQIQFISAFDEHDDLKYQWERKPNSGCFYYSPITYTILDAVTERLFIAYSGETFFVFNSFDNKLISKKLFKNKFKQLTPKNQIFTDSEATYYFAIEENSSEEYSKTLNIELEEFLNYPIKANSEFDEMNNNDIGLYFYGTQHSTHFELIMLNIRDRWNYTYEEVRRYKFDIPGSLIEGRRLNDSVYSVKTDSGSFILPDLALFRSMRKENPCMAAIESYPYEIIFGGDNFIFRNIMGNYQRKPATIINFLEFIFLNPFILLLVCLILLVSLNSYIAKKRNSAKNSSE